MTPYFLLLQEQSSRRDEVIQVNGMEFRYRSGVHWVGYRKPLANGGLLDTGATVRIHYKEHRILKIEGI